MKHLAALGRAYRAYALAEPNYYRIMFEAAVPGFRPGPEAYAESRETLAILVGVVEECVKAGVFTEGEPAAIADTFWMAAHGAVSLELAGIFGPEEGERRFHMLTTALVRAYGTQSRPGPAEPDQERNRQ
ncbi:TetR-like C-terminal domain-containing protein [Thermocatellispora tengchongensis]|uniref:TetR-like C-terminal domain-containing protein n=1 Tax=Thermocatellispora tengchongensis TaxID=1073253 RepID=UPI0036389A9F